MRINIDHSKTNTWEALRCDISKLQSKFDKFYKFIVGHSKKEFSKKSEISDYVQNNFTDNEILHMASEWMISKFTSDDTPKHSKQDCDCPNCNPKQFEKNLSDNLRKSIDDLYP